MRKTRVSILSLAAALVLGGSASPVDGLQVEGDVDFASVRRFWTELDAAWVARDAETFVDFFTPDASFAVVDRDLWLEGRGSLYRYFAEQFGNQREELRHVTEAERFRRLSPRAMTIAVDGEVKIVDTRRDSHIEFRRLAITAVMVEGADGWRIQLLRAYTLPLDVPGCGS